MYAVMGAVDIEPDRVGEAETIVRDMMAPMLAEMPGFVAATWTRSLDDTKGRSLIIFETEEQARAAVDSRPETPPGAPIQFTSIDIAKVVHQA